MSAMLLALLPLLPAAAGGVLLVSRTRKAWAPAIAVVVLALASAASVFALSLAPKAACPWLGPLTLSLDAGGAAGVFALLVAVLAFLITVYSAFFLGRDEARGRFFGFMLLFTGAMLGLVLAADLLTLLIAWEVVGLCSYALIGFWYAEAGRARDAMRAFLTTRAADLGLYVAAMAAWAGGSLALARLPELTPGLRDMVGAGLLLAAVGKSAQLPLSGWLSGAMSGPTPVSALLHSAAMVAAGAMLLVKVLPLLEALPWMAETVLWTGVASALFGALVALAQHDLKQVLAASTISQYGYVFAAIGAAGGAAASAYLVNHAVFKALLFLGAGLLILRGLHSLSEMGGLHRRLPMLSLLFLAGSLSLATLPPFGGFFAKEAVMGAVHEKTALGFWLLMASAVLTACYAGRSWLGAFTGPLGADVEGGEHPGRLAPMAVLALAALIGGLLVLPPVKHWWESAIVVGHALPPLKAWTAALATAAVLAGLAVAWLGRSRSLTFAPAERWFLLPRLLDLAGAAVIGTAVRLHAVFSRLSFASRIARGGLAMAVLVGGARGETKAANRVLALAQRVGSIEDSLVQPAMSSSGRRSLGSAQALMVFDRRALEGALLRLTGSLDQAGQRLRRAQSGLLHQYYAGMAAGVAALLGLAGLLTVA